MSGKDYFEECISESCSSCGIKLSTDDIQRISADVFIAHENYGMAFYSPPSTDRLSVIQNEADAKYKRLEQEFDRYRRGAEAAVKNALHQHKDANISIDNDGFVTRYDGRAEQIL
jgi:hypothetical protein